MVKPTSISLLRGEEDPDCTLSNVGELLKSKAEEGVRVLLLIWNDKSSGGMFGMNPYMVLSNGTPKNNKNKNKKINLPKIVAYGTFRRNRLHSAARTNITSMAQLVVQAMFFCAVRKLLLVYVHLVNNKNISDPFQSNLNWL